MEDDGPALGVGFAIDTEGAFSELLRFAQMFDDKTVAIVRQVAEIERATGGMMRLEPATARIATFANASTSAERAIRREKAQTERSIESMIKALERETLATGRSREEQRAARIEALAAAAARQGNTDAVDRLYASTRALDMAQKSLAEDKLAAEIKATAAATRERERAEAGVIAQLLERSRLEAALDRITGANRPTAAQGGASFSALAERERALELAQRETAAARAQNNILAERASIESALARTTGAGRGRATDSGATFSALAAKAADDEARATAAAAENAARLAREHSNLVAMVRGSQAAMEADAAAAERLRMSTDPLYAATKRVNDEIAESTRLYQAGATSAPEYARQQDILAGRLRAVNEASGKASGGIGDTGETAKIAQHHMLNYGYQIQDLGVQFAMAAQSSDPLKMAMMALLQQGSQITQISQQAGVGIGAMTKQMIMSTGAFIAGSPAILGTAAAVGTALFAFKGFSDTLEKRAPVDDYIKTLGLTAEEAKKLADTHVTLGDAAGAAWDVIGKALGLESVFKKLNGWVSQAAMWLYSQFKDAAASVWGAMKAVYENIGLLWKKLPALIGDAVVFAVNQVLDAAQFLVNDSINKINWLAGKSNEIFGTKFSQIKPVDLSRYKGQYSAAGKEFAAAFGSSFNAGYKQAMDGFGAIEDGALAKRNARMKDQADKIIKDRKKGSTKAQDDAEKEAERIQKWLADQRLVAQGNVWKLAQDVVARNLSWGKGDKTWGENDIAAREAAEKLRKAAAENTQDALAAFMRQLDKVSDRVDTVAANMRRAFGNVGGSIGDTISILDEFGKRQAEITQQKDLGLISDTKAREQSLSNQLSGMIALTGAAKGLFSEHSKGYKAMAAAEKALTIIQLARTAVDVAGGAARMFATLGPFGFPAVAAMIGVMASLGFSGGGRSATMPTTNDGTGSVLGDSSAKSDSIKRSLDNLKAVDLLMLSTSRQMAASLKSIDSQIGGFASLVLRTGDVNASEGVNAGFKANAIGSILGSVPVIGGILKGLFGTKTTVVGSGLYGGAQSLGDILSGGFDASYYSDVQKKKKLFGLTTSTKYSTQFSGADAGLENQFTLILREFNAAIVAAAGPLGSATDEIQRRLNGFVVNIGKIDLQGLTGEQIQEKLSAVFGKAADEMARAAFPGIDRFQKAGEGLFETLVRVSSTVESVTSSLGMLGLSATGMSVDLKVALAGQFDSIGDFTDATTGYFETFYTKEEQARARLAQFGDVFTSLGVAMPSSLAGFRSLVEAQDLTTAAGQATYATLLKLAPAFADLQAAMNGAKSAADIAAERQDLQRKLLELQGDTAAIRALDLAGLDESNRALQQQIWALQDAKEASDAAKQLAEAWTSVGDSIMDEVKRIRGLSSTTGSTSFASLMGEFNAATTAARGGDQDAAKLLPGLSQSLLTAAANAATSRQELDRIRAQTAASLEATYGVITALTKGGATPSGSIKSNNLGVVDAAALQSAGSNSGAANDDATSEIRAMREELAQMRRENTAGHAATAGNTGKVARILGDVTDANGGKAISVSGAAA